MKKKKLDLTFIVLAYNEEKNIISALNEILDNLNLKKYEYEILVMDDCSNDNTYFVVKNFLNINSHLRNIRIIKNSNNLGQFDNIKKGVGLTRSGKFTIIPGDNQINLKNFINNYNKISHEEVFYGFATNEIEERGKFRTFLSHLWRLLMLLFFGTTTVYLAGLIIYKTDIFKKINVKHKNFFGLYELGIITERIGISIIQGPFKLRKREFGSSTSLSIRSIIYAPYFIFDTWLNYKSKGLFKEGRKIKNLKNLLSND